MVVATKQEQFLEQGYLVEERLFSDQECDELLEAIDSITQQFDYSEGVHLFGTGGDGRPQMKDRWFLDSAKEVRYFFETHAFDEKGELKVPPADAINKIGHALHLHEPAFARYTNDPRITSLLGELGLQQPELKQSMVIFKQPGIGGEVCTHQDASFLLSEPDSVIGLWLALEDADEENACLWVERGGHDQPLRYEMHRTEKDEVNLTHFEGVAPFDESALIPVPVPKGTLIALHGKLPHGSVHNKSSRRRTAVTLHYYDKGRSSWRPENWLR